MTMLAPTAPAHTAESLLDPWVVGLRSRSEETARKYELAVRQFLAVTEGDLSPAGLARYLAWMHERELSNNSLRLYLTAVRSYLNFLAAYGVIGPHVLTVLRLPRSVTTSRRVACSIDELRRLIEAADRPQARAAILLMAGAGLRVAEAARARWCDLYRDPAGRLGLRVVGKGSRERHVAVPDEVFACLAAIHGDATLDHSDRSCLVRRPNSPTTPYTSRHLHRFVVEAAAKAKLPHVSPHVLRHTYATLAAQGGAPSYALQAALGHARLDTSAQYVHWAKGLDGAATYYLPPLLKEDR